MTMLVDLADLPAQALPMHFLAQTGTPAIAPAPAGTDAAPQPGALQTFIPFLMIAGVFLLIMAPQMKRNKEHKKLINSLEPGAEVLTTGGVFGVVTAVKPDRFVVEIAKGVRIEVNRANVEARVSPAPATTDDNKDKKL